MRTSFLLFLLLGITACTSKSSQQADSDLPVIDLEKEYPVKRIDIHEIADVEYIPLETTDESLLMSGYEKSISGKYIVVSEFRNGYNFYIFSREGKYLRTIDRQGQGPGEYINYTHFEVDFEKEELFILTGTVTPKIMVYGLDGKFLREFQLPSRNEEHYFAFANLYNYDKEFLITYNDLYWPSPNKKYYRAPDKTPYYLINKKDGSIRPIEDLTLDNPFTSIFRMGQDTFGNYNIKQGYEFLHMQMNGASETLIVEKSLDTLYLYKDHVLEPIMVRTPQIATMSPLCFIAPCAFSDKYFIYRKVTMIRDEEKERKEFIPYDPRDCPAYIMYRETGEIFRLELYDSNLSEELRLDKDVRTAFPGNDLFNTSTEKGEIGAHYNITFLFNQLEKNTYKGKLKEIVSNMVEDDNPLTVIYTFK